MTLAELLKAVTPKMVDAMAYKPLGLEGQIELIVRTIDATLAEVMGVERLPEQ